MNQGIDVELTNKSKSADKQSTLALGMVIRDASKDVETILISIGHLFDEIILVLHKCEPAVAQVIKSIGTQYGATCLETDISSFDQARNLYLSSSSSDWLLVLDADERMAPSAVSAIRAMLDTTNNDVGALLIPIYEYFGKGRWVVRAQARLMRPQSACYNQWFYHAGIGESMHGAGLRIAPCGVSNILINHLGGLRNSEQSKRIPRIQQLESQLNTGSNNPFILTALAMEHLALGNIRRSHECIELALNLQHNEASRPRQDVTRYLLAILHYRLNLTWLAQPVLEEVAENSLVFNVYAQCMLADLDYREGRVDQAIRRLEVILEERPNASDVLVNAASLAAAKEPEKAIAWALHALEITPSLTWSKIYTRGASYNLLAVLDYFVGCYDNIYSVLHRAHIYKGDPSAAKQWKEKEQIIVYNQ